MFWVEYSQKITGIPKALAAVPLISNIIVLASIFQAKIFVPCLDEDFYNSINEFMFGYEKMYPTIDFQYQDAIVCDTIIDTKSKINNSEEENAMLYFSGGVDAYTSLIRHEHENIILLTVCGADTWYYNKVGFNEIIRQNEEIAKLHNLRIVSCISTLRKFINEKEIYAYINPLINDNFWHGFQHGVGMFGLSAGYVYLYDLKKIYFASSFCEKDEKISCGSDPSIDNYYHIGTAKVHHDGFELSRQDKVASLCNYSKNEKTKIKLRVCYSSAKGTNCCECEKCTRTMMGILAEGYNPVDFGFELYNEKKIYLSLMSVLKSLSSVPQIAMAMYGEMIKKYQATYSYEQCPDEMKVFYNSNFKDILLMLFYIKQQESTNNENDILPKNTTTLYETYFKDYVTLDSKRYTNLCKYVCKKGKLKPAQEKEYWIGNHGFVLNQNDSMAIEGHTITVDLARESVIFDGWAADFVSSVPFSDVFVKIDHQYYCLNYGQENLNLAKYFNNTSFQNIAYKAKLPSAVFKKLKRKKISFYMVGYLDGKVYRYPEINYKISIKK